MSGWGKFLAVMVVVAGLAAMIFTAKLINVRNSWAAKANKFATEYAKAAADAQTATEQRTLVLHELERMNREWGTDFAAAGGKPTQSMGAPAEGRLEVGMGVGSGLAERNVIHGFELKADGSSVYRGPFVVSGPPQAERAAVQPNWRVRPGETADWQAGQWRWRSSIPATYSQLFDEMMLSFTKGDETLADRKASAAIQDKLLAEATAALARRQAELVGGDELPKDETIPPEFRQGLVTTLEAAEEERNGVLLEIAALRRQVRAARDAVQQLQQDNLSLQQKLPGKYE